MTMLRHTPGFRRRRRHGRGQGLVEFALVLPIFILILFGLIDLGRYVYLNSTLSQAAREGARVASVEAFWMGKTDPSCGSAAGPVCPTNLTALGTDVLAGANRMITPFAAIASSDLAFTCGSTPSAAVPNGQACATPGIGYYVSVRVASTFRPLTPIISSIFPTIDTRASAAMVIN
jgi:Flp pilus assembly protein TadG